MNHFETTATLLAANSAESAGVLLGSIFVGVLCGIGPFIMAVTKRSPNLGVIALFSCILAGFFAGILLAAPVGIAWAIGLSFKGKRSRRY